MQSEGPWGLGLPCLITATRGFTSWKQRSCACKNDEVEIRTQQGIRNGLGETMSQAGRLNGQAAQQPGLWKNTLFFCSSSSVAMLAPSRMWWGTEVEQVTFEDPSQACDSVMSHIFPLFKDVSAQEVQVDTDTNGRGVQNVKEYFCLS